MNAPQITFRDPKPLRPHPDTACLYSLPDADPRFQRIVDGMIEHGFDPDEPLKLDSAGLVVDGRHRLRAAKLAGLAQVPCLVVPDNQVDAVILRSILARKHFTKSALAFECYPLFEKAHLEAIERKRQLAKTGNRGTILVSDQDGRTVEQIAALLGIGRSLFDDAAEVHRIFKLDPEYRDLMLPRIYGEMVGGEHEDKRPRGLGAIIAGWTGRSGRTQAAAAKARAEESRQLRLFAENLKEDRWEYWSGFDEAEKRVAKQRLAASCEAMPDDLLQAYAAAIKAEEKRRQQEEPA